MADCKKCRFRSICKKRPKMEGATIAECDLFRNDIERIEPMTNADRIRAMSDEELRDFLFNQVSVDRICNFCVPKMRTERKCDGYCKNGVLDWLKQPAEE